jgi:hypothetical protein
MSRPASDACLQCSAVKRRRRGEESTSSDCDHPKPLQQFDGHQSILRIQRVDPELWLGSGAKGWEGGEEGDLAIVVEPTGVDVRRDDDKRMESSTANRLHIHSFGVSVELTNEHLPRSQVISVRVRERKGLGLVGVTSRSQPSHTRHPSSWGRPLFRAHHTPPIPRNRQFHQSNGPDCVHFHKQHPRHWRRCPKEEEG